MNEQAIQDAYNLFVQTGYKGDINAFSNLIKTNPNALNDSYNLFTENGYNGGYDDYKTLVGVNQAQGADLLKKKGRGTMAQMVPQTTTESFVEESLSASQPKKQVAQPQPKQKAGILAQPVIKPTTESFLEAVSVEPSTQPTEVKKPKVTDETPKEQDYFQGDFGKALKAIDEYAPFFGIGDDIDDIGRAVGAGFKTGAILSPAMDLYIKDKKATPEQIKKYVQAAKEMEGVGPSDEMQKFSKIYDESGKGVWGLVKGLAENPDVIPELLITSTAMMFNKATAATAGATIATGAAIGGVAGAPVGGIGAIPGAIGGGLRAIPYAMGAASATLETGLTFSELLKEEIDKRGLEFNEENVKKILEDDKVVSSIRGKSAARGATIGIVDALTGRLAGKVGAKLLKGTSASRVKSGLATAGIEAAGGSIGEAGGRLVAGQEMDVAEIGLEGISSVPGAIPALAAEVLNKPIYKINGQRVTENDVKDIVDNTPVAELGKINFEFTNDRSNWKQIVQDKVVTHSTKEQVREANPDLNETSLDAITKLELDLQKLEGNTTQSGKDKAAALRQQIKGIQENQLQEEAAQQNVLGNAYRSQRISDAQKALAQPENKAGTVTIDDKEVPRVELEKELETLKAEQDAIQKQSTNAEMLRSEQPELGLREVGEGNTGPTETTGASTEVISDEKSQEIGNQVGDLVETLTLFNQGTQQGGTPNEKSVRTRKANKAYKKLGEFFGFPYGTIDTPEQSNKQSALRTLGSMLDQESERGYFDGTNFYQFADTNELMTAYKADKANGIASPVVQSIDTLLGITPEVAPVAVTETVTEAAPEVSSKTQEVEVVPTAQPVQIDEQTPTRLQELVDLIGLAFFQPFGTTKEESRNRKTTSEESKDKLTELLGADFKNDGSRSDDDKLIVNSLGAIKRMLDKNDKKFKFETIQDLLTSYQNDKSNGVDSDLVKSVDTVLNAQRDVADIEAAANEAVAEEVEPYEPITAKDISYETFTRDNASDYEEDEREGDNGRSYTYFSSISIPIMNQDGDTIGYLVKMADSDGELTFDAQFEDQESISGEEGDVFSTLGAARDAFIEAYNKKQQEEIAAEANEKAQEKAREKVKAAKKAAKAAAKEGAAKVEEVQSLVDELLALDPNDKSTAQKASDALGGLIKDIQKFEKTSLGVNVALPIIKGILQAVKALIDAGISLQQALKQVAKDNNITEQQVRDNINIVPILDGFNEVMTKVEALIARQKSKNVPDAKIVSNVDTFIRNSEVYKAANDAQKKILEKEGRAKMGVEERRAPSIGRVLGALQDFTNITREEKIQIIKQIRTLSKDAAKSLSNEIKEMANTGKITVKQAANVIAKFGQVNLLNEISVGNFVDYMAKVFNNAEYAQKIDTVKKQLAIAKKNIATKIGKADGLMGPLQKLFAINPNLIPDSVFEDYLKLVDMFGQRQAVLTLDEKSEVIKQVEAIRDALNKEQSLAVELAMRLEGFKGVKFNENGRIDYAATIKAMLEDKAITEEEAELMRKYKSDIVTQVEPEPKSDKEIEAEKQVLLDALDKTEVNPSGLSSRYERDLAKRLAKLIKTDAVDKLSVAELKNLLKVIDNINNNYVPHFAQLMVERLNSINNDKILVSSLNRAKLLPITKAYAKIKSLFTGKNNISEMIRRNPLFLVDQMLGDFKTKDVFNALFDKSAEGVAAFHTELNRIQNILENAETKVAKSFNMDPNKTLMSKFKMMTYLIQLEFESNKGNKQVNQASDFIKATIKHIKSDKSTFGKMDAKVLSEILSTYANEKGNIDINKLYNSFNDAEKSAIKDIRTVNESLVEKAEDTATIIRGQKFNPLNNYVHLNVLHETEPRDLTVGSSFANEYNNSRRPSTKAKSLIERTGEVSPLNFDVFSSAQRGAKFVLLDYNLTEPIRTGRRTLDLAQITLQQEADEKARAKARTNGLARNEDIDNITGEIDEQTQDILNALRNAYEEAVSNLLTNSMVSSTLADRVAQYMTKQGYRAVLAGTGRFASELMSNIAFATLVDPKAFAAGLQDTGFVLSAEAVDFMNNVKSKQTSRIFPTDTLSGRAIDTNIIDQSVGIVGGRTNNAIANRIKQIWNISGKKYLNTVELTADALITTPDKAVMRPMWFGSFMNEFEKITGEKVDKQKVAENDEEYMNKYKDAIEKAKNVADERSVLTGATDNAFMGILKGTVKPDQNGFNKAFNTFNNYMTKFLNFEYAAARTGIYAAMGNGSLTKQQGAAVLAGVTTRMIVYSLLTKALGDGLVGLFFGEEEEEEDDKSFLQELGQASASAFTSMLIGRDFGNITKQIANYGIELLNEKYLDILRNGEYDPYKDSIQFSLLGSSDKNKKNDLNELLVNMTGPYAPALKTANFAFKKATEEPKKKADAIERQKREINERLPLEIFGNLGAIPLYKEIRKVVMKDIYKSLADAEKNAGDKKKAELEKLQGFETEGDMKRYDPALWDRTYGPSSEGYDARQAEKALKREKERMERAIKDAEYNYVPTTRRSRKSSGFGPQEGGSSSSFGPQKSKSKSSFGPQ